jgi:hypothetical protein
MNRRLKSMNRHLNHKCCLTLAAQQAEAAAQGSRGHRFGSGDPPPPGKPPPAAASKGDWWKNIFAKNHSKPVPDAPGGSYYENYASGSRPGSAAPNSTPAAAGGGGRSTSARPPGMC